MKDDPVKAIDRTKYMDEQEVKKLREKTKQRALLDASQDRKTGVLVWMVVDIALSTGLRVNEIAKLKVGDVDLNRGHIRVKRSKLRKDVRESMAVSQELISHLRKFIDWKKSNGQSIDGSAALFVGKRGVLTRRGLQQIWKAAIRKAELPEELSIHSARHTLAVTLLKKTGNLRLVQKQLGHTSPTTTANMYADISFEDIQIALNGLFGDDN